MSDIAIRVENLSKLYTIGARQERHDTIRDALASRLRRRTSSQPTDENDLWALRDVSFDVHQGEVVGIIGRNGAGKSTLLKILSRITEPTSGRVTLHGRVASLLEVGTGFHPELTGRENIYLNGAILGMKRREIDRKFDEIVAFAEIERFLDTPVKRYSSGMYVRLAFAVAAHLEPEILLVDEVLAVGDAGFQKKCLGKMGDVAKQGRTVLFVSHNMAAIRSLCRWSLLIVEGTICDYGPTKPVIANYLEDSSFIKDNETTVDLLDHPHRLPKMQNILLRVALRNSQMELRHTFFQSEVVVIEIDYDCRNRPVSLSGIGFILESSSGSKVGGFNTYMTFHPPHILPKAGTIRFSLKSPSLLTGRYYISVSAGAHQNHLIDKVERAIRFDVLADDLYGTGYLFDSQMGLVALQCDTELLEMQQ